MIMKTVKQGAQTTIYLAVAEEVEGMYVRMSKNLLVGMVMVN